MYRKNKFEEKIYFLLTVSVNKTIFFVLNSKIHLNSNFLHLILNNKFIEYL